MSRKGFASSGLVIASSQRKAFVGVDVVRILSNPPEFPEDEPTVRMTLLYVLPYHTYGITGKEPD